MNTTIGGRHNQAGQEAQLSQRGCAALRVVNVENFANILPNSTQLRFPVELSFPLSVGLRTALCTASSGKNCNTR